MSSKETQLKRRRGEALENAILDAAWQELKVTGYNQLTFDKVAYRAGTSKPVLYRRWPNRLALVLATVRRHRTLHSELIPDTGSLRGDVVALLERVSGGVQELPPDVAYGALAEIVGNHEQQPTFRDLILSSNISAMSTILQNARKRGEKIKTNIPDRIAVLPLALNRHEMITTGKPATKAAIAEIVDEIFLPLVRR